MPTNWNDIKVIEGVLVAYLASNNNKIDLREVARLYGNGMTYDALEYHFRPWKTQAKDLKAAAVNDTVATPKKPHAKNSSSPSKNTSRSPSKKADKVQAGRVSKNKLVGGGNVKMEDLGDNINAMIDSVDYPECV